jgi:folate-binding protein YgfZ
VILEDRGIVLLEGSEAGAFLQGLISNDVDKVTDTESIYAALLTPQGKFLHDFFVLRHGDAYLLDCEGPRLGDLGQRLAAYKLRADISLADATEDYRVIALFGPGSDEALALPPGPGRTAPLPGGGLFFRDPRRDNLGLRALLPRDQDPAIFGAQGFTPGTFADYESHRLSLGVPDGSRDMTVEKATLMECDFEALNGVDFEKGCYVGQELTARTKHRGLVRKRLMRVALNGPLPATGTRIMAGDKEAGEMRSGLDGQALALLRFERIADAADAGTPLTAGDTRVKPLDRA